MEQSTPNDLITLEDAGKITDKSVYFFLIAGGKKEIDIYFPFSSGMGKYSPEYIQSFLNSGCKPVKFPGNLAPYRLESTALLHVSKIEAILLSNTARTIGNSALEKLKICGIEMILGNEASRQAKEGFEAWKKNLEKKFHEGIRAGTAVAAYCMKQDIKITKNDLQNLLYRDKTFPDTEELEKFAKIPKDLIEDIYSALPDKFRHGPGEKKPQTS